jgi:hypothetical protein
MKKWVSIYMLALCLVWHSEKFLTQASLVSRLNEISCSAKDIKIVMGDEDWFYLIWATEESK